MDEIAKYEVEQTREQDLPGRAENTVDDADKEDENVLRKIETVAEDWWLDCFSVV